MTAYTRDVINSIGYRAAIQQFDEVITSIVAKTDQSREEAIMDFTANIARNRQATPLPAYERVLLDVANGRPRPKNFDASGP